MSELDDEQPIDESADSTVDFTDDSSRSFELGHGATHVDDRSWLDQNNARLKKQCERDGIPYGATDHPLNKGAYTDVERHIDQVRRENRDLPEIEVVRIGRERASGSGPVITPADRNRDYMGAPTSVLMAHDAPKGGGSKSGTQNEKPSKWKCNECHIEFCIHRKPKSRKKKTGNRVGRQPVNRDGSSASVGRSGKITGCVSPTTPQAVREDGTASAGEIIDAVVDIAQRQGVPISNVLDNLDETKPKHCEQPGCPDDGGYAAFDDLGSRYRYYCAEHIFVQHDWEKELKETA